MQALFQSAFLHALGYAIFNSLWQAALLWLIVMIVNGLFKLSSVSRYRIALLSQLMIFSWFFATLIFYYEKGAEAIYAGTTFSDSPAIIIPDAHNFNSLLLSAIIRAEALLPLLSVAYLCLLSFQIYKWCRGYQYTNHIKTNSLQKIDAEWKFFVKRIAGYLEIKQDLKIYLSSLVKSPLTIGFIKPVILIPLACINNLNAQQMEAVILHELAHIKRADYLFNMLQLIIEMILFFNPFSKLLSNMIHKERENCCDDWVLQFQYNPVVYAEALLKIACLNSSPCFAMSASGKKEGDLLLRVKRMLKQKDKTFQYRNYVFALLSITILLSFTTWHRKASDVFSGNVNQKQSVIIVPLTAQIDNPFFNPLFFLKNSLSKEVSDAIAAVTTSRKKSEKKLNKSLTQEAPLAISEITLERLENTSKLLSPNDEAGSGESTSALLKQDDELNNNTESFTDAQKSMADGMALLLNQNNFLQQAEKATQELNELNLEKSFSAFEKEKIEAKVQDALSAINLKNVQISLEKLTTAKTAQENQIKKAEQKVKQIMELEKKFQKDILKPYIHQLELKADSIANVYSISQNFDSIYTKNYFINTALNSSLYNQDYSDDVNNDHNTIVSIKEDKKCSSNYKKKITVETIDRTGKKHSFKLTIELYQ